MASSLGYPQVVLADSPASYWRLGELRRNASAGDSAGSVTGTYGGVNYSGANGTITGLPLPGCAGPIQGDANTAQYFDIARQNLVDLGNTYGFTGVTPFSAEAWVQPLALSSTWNIVISKVGNNANGFQGWQIVVHNDGSAQFFRSLNGVQKTAQSATGAVPTNTWSHLVGTYDGTTSRLYINGALAASIADTQSLVATTFHTFIANDGGANYFTGSIAEVAVYNTALSATRIAAHYNAARFATNAPAFVPAVTGQAGTAAQVNQFLGSHTLAVCYQGTMLGSGSTYSTTVGGTWSLGTQWVDQPFTLPSPQTRIDRVEIAMQRLGTGSDITVTLRPDNSGNPSSTILSTVVVPLEFVPTSRIRMVSIPFATAGLTPGATYHVVLQTGGSGTNTLQVFDAGTGSPALKTSTNGTTWTAQTKILFAGFYAGDAPPQRNVVESSQSWAEVEYDNAGHPVGVYEMVQSARTAHAFAQSTRNRLTSIV